MAQLIAIGDMCYRVAEKCTHATPLSRPKFFMDVRRLVCDWVVEDPCGDFPGCNGVVRSECMNTFEDWADNVTLPNFEAWAASLH